MAEGLKLYNTLTRSKVDFTPIDPKNVRMYVCGPTVYDFAHIGNARPVIVFDVLYRLLRHIYGENHVTYARNITDVDDKINARALRDFPDLPLNEAIAKVTQKTADQFHADVAALGNLPPTIEPRATDNIQQMIDIIKTLIAKGHAYVAEGEVLFDTRSMAAYGQLSKRNLDEQQAGARIAVEAHKKHPGDFVLWKLSSHNEPGWESPWGRGRPGWHIECSAMSKRYLGEVFDIHGGGLDLIFPHHENEIAQSCCANDTSVMANVWMHNGFVQVEGRKMSKSDGNFFTINELLDTENFGGRKWPGEVLRLAMLMTHYREPIDFSVKRLEEALNISRIFYETARGYSPDDKDEIIPEVTDALNDDLNTPRAIQAIQRGGYEKRRINKSIYFLGLQNQQQEQENIKYNNELRKGRLKAIHAAYFDVFRAKEKGLSSADIDRSVETRLELINAKEFDKADDIRKELMEKGINLKDSKDKETGKRTTFWEIKD
ncbi:cysteine--tRNA ligase [Agrobacterium vitis]|uniref:cysteine--tRNA ligase n=1 Tax=Allorhizobium ampelinum TaxID=3025782 RepID=UPI001EEDB0E0|nr:cysteine--tRNA ligase [Allorhizobium ampelinum]MCF1472764.1 cysteine--tRNA ligase [Allorhizobium ampelinum]